MTKPTSEVAIRDDQEFFNQKQLATLRRAFGGAVRGAEDGDFALLFNQVRRTGLDPFIGQIYLIMREEYDSEIRARVKKPTIQIGIDGFRNISNKAARRDKVRISHHNPMWQNKAGEWFDSWDSEKEEYPLACKYKISMTDGSFVEMTAMFNEYCPMVPEYAEGPNGGARQKTGKMVPGPMWRKMPASQLAKCAEAITLRKGFPQDLSGLYVMEEMEQAGIVDVAPVETSEGTVHQVVPQEGQRDWLDELAKAETGERVTQIWKEAKEAGQRTKAVEDLARARGKEFAEAIKAAEAAATTQPEIPLGPCILTGAEGEIADDHSTHDHAVVDA